ncbi:1-phosphofructokinase family hexose kinase [Mangrovicella endophytica]|uniref:1-phosphofructokinase family hexose kinase n=1 Tax=Mangrovicella endophytica TaxID=2066697 RepID=UPI000C9E6F35|nr:PfkB family carbohydrate kinase [Mangrovicella endophytica]
MAAGEHLSETRAPERGEICVFAPWPLFTITIEKRVEGGDDVYFHAGGQAVWVARMIANLGQRATLVGPFGGEARHVIETLVKMEGLGLRSVPIKLPNGGYINDRRGGKREEIATVKPPHLDRHETDDLYNAVLSESLRCGTVVLTGLPEDPVIPLGVFGRLTSDLSGNGVAIIADIAGEVLKAVERGLSVLKISHEELIAAGVAEGDDRDELVAGMERLREKSEDIVVSCAGEGSLALIGGTLFHAKAPSLNALDHTGAGDSMTAALAVAKAGKLNPQETLRLATAAGALNVTRHGRGTGNFHDIQEIARHVTIEEIRR